MGKGLTLLGAGDSWAWGTELIDPTLVDRKSGWDFGLHHRSPHKEYRENHRYLKLFGDKIGATKIADISQGGCSNDTIVRNLIRWLTSNDYLSGRDPGDLFVSIGWTSPERKDFCYKDTISHNADEGWFTLYPLFSHRMDNIPELEKFHEIYVNNFWNAREYMHRWVTQVWQTELLLKSFNIKYVMHQAFYHHYQDFFKQITKWNDKAYLDEHFLEMNKADQKLWNLVDPIKFMHKDDSDIGTFHHYIGNKVGKENIKQVLLESHPNELGHSIWADHMYDYCKEHNLL